MRIRYKYKIGGIETTDQKDHQSSGAMHSVLPVYIDKVRTDTVRIDTVRIDTVRIDTVRIDTVRIVLPVLV